jgi:hypothetical protein
MRALLVVAREKAIEAGLRLRYVTVGTTKKSAAMICSHGS